ncbi:type IV pilus secretin family protein [Dactylococcopsis salina]|uniref:Type II secretory pathway, component HofQ n=1 Tax=Dactylococcopsis salina (strain PCC 8305) TaxID=13035 RepID=K9Z007_DACS8|nr:type IV pilus secretin family protein [Dactylococcopsis salina]AFZ51683.1 type II secretory pathway, component HofQ [Dactylococcopsis salina PCC 8305]
MRNYLQKIGIGFSVTSFLLSPSFVQVAATQVENVRLQRTEQGFNIRLATNSNKRPQIFRIKRDNVLVVDVTNTQLDLENSNLIERQNPFPGVEYLSISQGDANSVRVIVRGTTEAPDARIASFVNGEVTLNVSMGSGGSSTQQAQREQTFSQESGNNSPLPSLENQGETQPEVMFPNPEITVDGQPTRNNQSSGQRSSPGLEPTRPRAVAPPVGDIAVSTINSAPDLVDLGTDTRVSRLVLREAPVREVLSLLARSANINLVFADQSGEEGENPADQTISVDLENESIQEAFNSILQLSGLEANRRGNTIFIGANLPQAVRNVMTRTLRLNQVGVSAASGFLATQGAEVQQVVTPVDREFNQETGALIRETEQPAELRPLTVNQPGEAKGALLLRGLSVSTDDRLNAITLVGESRKIATAVDLLKQLDARRRQVAVNVKIIDVNLSNQENFNTSFSFGIADTFFSFDGGQATVGVGDLAPPSSGQVRTGSLNRPIIPNPNPSQPFADFVSFPDRFLAQLQAQVTSGNAKILTDPTLLIKEGQTAGVNLTQEVVGNITRETESSEGVTTITTTAEIEEAGLQLNVDVQRVDDNGFITLNVNPTVTSIGGTQALNVGGNSNTIALLNKRELNSGEIRLRDGQTLILAGIIQDEDRTTVTKVPILGDLPILGSLFRSTQRNNIRREVIVLLTPNVLDDSLEAGGFGTNYQPSPAAREML